MNANKIMTMQKLYTTIGKIIDDFSENANKTTHGPDDNDSPCKNHTDSCIERLKDAQECVMDAAMIALEQSFEAGTLNVQ